MPFFVVEVATLLLTLKVARQWRHSLTLKVTMKNHTESGETVATLTHLHCSLTVSHADEQNTDIPLVSWWSYTSQHNPDSNLTDKASKKGQHKNTHRHQVDSA